ncbi:MAG: F0F1 ATP synthase subunit delta, partial [Rhodobacteraceae bacterium]|nr:F0F1 ATP synthase subunit delta [Paracoccaceae bacterium]
FADWSSALGFAARVASDPRVAGLLGNPKLDDADAVALLSPEGAQPLFGNFLALLADNRRLVLLPEIAGLYEELRADAERVVKARVTSATDLPAGELEAIKAALGKRFGREVEIETAVDASLIGGAVIDAGDVVIDGSLKGKLERLQAELGQ